MNTKINSINIQNNNSQINNLQGKPSNNNTEKLYQKHHIHKYKFQQIQQHNIQQQVAKITGTGYNINLYV